MKDNISMHWTVTWTTGLRYNTRAFHLRPLILNNVTADWGFRWFHNHWHLDIVRVKEIAQFQWLLLPRSTAPTWSFDMIKESIWNLISNYVENQETEYLHYLDFLIHVPLSHLCKKSSKWSAQLLKLESWMIPLGPFGGIEGMHWALKDLQHCKWTN